MWITHHSVLGKRAAAHEVEQALAFAGKSGGPVCHQASTLSEPAEDEISLKDADAHAEPAEFKSFYLIFWHKLVFGCLQILHSQHCGMYGVWQRPL